MLWRTCSSIRMKPPIKASFAITNFINSVSSQSTPRTSEQLFYVDMLIFFWLLWFFVIDFHNSWVQISSILRFRHVRNCVYKSECTSIIALSLLSTWYLDWTKVDKIYKTIAFTERRDRSVWWSYFGHEKSVACCQFVDIDRSSCDIRVTTCWALYILENVVDDALLLQE